MFFFKYFRAFKLEAKSRFEIHLEGSKIALFFWIVSLLLKNMNISGKKFAFQKFSTFQNKSRDASLNNSLYSRNTALIFDLSHISKIWKPF